jgi:hypothetical protein
MYMSRVLTSLATAALGLGVASASSAQVVTVDEGSFTITRNGQPAGREDFRIRRTPAAGGAEYVASATVALGDRRLSPDLRANAKGAPIAYRLEVRVGGDTEERLTGQVGRGRFSAQLKTPRGESMREYVVSDGALVLDDDVFHQYYFVALGARSGPVPVVVPRRNVQVTMRVQRGGSESLQVGGRDIEATHLVLVEPGAGERLVWVDEEGRVLKVTIPARGIIVQRDEAPR